MKITDINGNQRECVKAYPDPNYPGFIKVEFKNPRRSYCEWYPIGEFMSKNPGFSSKYQNLMHEDPPEVTSLTTDSTDITLTDKTQKWQSNAYTGFPLWIAIGKGEGQVRTVISNTKDTLVIDKEWNILPNKFSQYVLSRNVHEKMEAHGNQSTKELQHKYELKAKKMDRDRKKAQKLITFRG